MKRSLILGIVFLFPVCGLLAQGPSQPQKPFTKVELMALVEADPRQAHLKWVVVQRGIDFHLTEAYLNSLKEAGAKDALIEAVRKAPVPAIAAGRSAMSPRTSAAPAALGPDAVTRENQVLPHLLRAAKLLQDRSWAEAEQEIRSALAIEPNNPLLHVDLSAVLPSSQGEPGWNAAIAEDREALRLDPELAVAHLRIARVILDHYDATPLPELQGLNPDPAAAMHRAKGVLNRRIKAAIDEYREVVRLNPDDAYACDQLGLLLEEAGDRDGVMAAYREAVARKPDDPLFHALLAEFLWKRPHLMGTDAQGRNDNEEAAKEMEIASALQAKHTPGRIRMGSWVTAYRLEYYDDSMYSHVREAALAGIEGSVRMEGVIRKDGSVRDLKVLSGHPALVKAAMERVSKYRYQPILLKGVLVEVATEIDVHFTIAW